MLFSVFLAGALVCFWAGTAWLQRSAIVTVELDPSGPFVVRSSAGPIELRGSDSSADPRTAAPPRSSDRGPTLEYEASWLLFGPDVRFGAETADPRAYRQGAVDISCETRFPCRAVSRLQLPGRSPAEVTIESVDGDVSVVDHVGDLTVLAGGSSGVFAGSVGGRMSVASEHGDVVGYGLTAGEVLVETVAGAVELDFVGRPELVTVRSESGPVTIWLPDGDYAVSVEGGSSVAINVGQAASADSTLQIHARGPVRIHPKR